MKFVSETNTYADGVRRAVAVREYTEEEDRRSLAAVQSQIAYQIEKRRGAADAAEAARFSDRIEELKGEEKRLMAAIAGYEA